jgi:hypothetical protein
MDEAVEGKLQLKRDSGGWRHYIDVDGQHRDIHCGSYMEVNLGEYEEPSGWGS